MLERLAAAVWKNELIADQRRAFEARLSADTDLLSDDGLAQLAGAMADVEQRLAHAKARGVAPITIIPKQFS